MLDDVNNCPTLAPPEFGSWKWLSLSMFSPTCKERHIVHIYDHSTANSQNIGFIIQ